MRAVVRDRYGPPDVLRVEEVPDPVPAAGQVLVRVVATSVNLSDVECLTGSPAYARLGGLRRPSRRVLGSDVAGVVEAVGPGATTFAIGDEVYGDNLELLGGFAELVVAKESALAPKPRALGFVEASTLPQSGAIAHQGTALVGPGSRVLVNGAGGGTGPLAIQLAKAAGARVTAVDNAGKLDVMRAAGADEVVDYRAEDWTRRGPFDHVLDLVAHRSVLAYRRALAPGGRYRCVGGSVRSLLRVVTAGTLVGVATGRSLGVLVVRQGPAHFAPVTERVLTGELRTFVDRVVPLEETAAALAHVLEGRARGKVVVRVAP